MSSKYQVYLTSQDGKPSTPTILTGGVYSKFVDFSQPVTLYGGATVNPGIGDTLSFLGVENGAIIRNAGVQIVTAGTGTGTVELIRDSDGILLMDTIATSVAGSFMHTDSLTNTPVICNADDAVDVVIGTATISAGVRVWVDVQPTISVQPQGPQPAFKLPAGH